MLQNRVWLRPLWLGLALCLGSAPALAFDRNAYLRDRDAIARETRLVSRAHDQMAEQARAGIADRAARRDALYSRYLSQVQAEEQTRRSASTVEVRTFERTPAQVLAEFKALAEAGSAEAARIVGQALMSGTGTAVDRPQAAQWFRRAAEAGDTEARAIWGTMLAYGMDGVKADPPTAARFLRLAAEAGDAPAAARLGFAYLRGRGVPANEAESVRWFRRGADAGVAEGQLGLGEALLFGRGGLARDEAQALPLLKRASAAGLVDAQLIVGTLAANGRVPGTPREQGAASVRALAERGELAAQRLMALLLLEGNGVRIDAGEARRWFERAASAGDAGSQWQLCAGLLNGELGPRDVAASRRHCGQAAEQGHPLGLLAMAEHLKGQHGGPVDRNAARALLQRALDAGDEAARPLLQALTDSAPAAAAASAGTAGTAAPTAAPATGPAVALPRAPVPGIAPPLQPSPVNYGTREALRPTIRALWHGDADARKAAFAKLEAAAKGGDAEAMFQISQAYWFGQGVNESGASCLEWASRAARLNHPDAMAEMARYYATGLATGTKDDNKAREMVERAAATGSAFALYTRASAHETGNYSFPKNIALAMEDLKLAAVRGHGEAMRFLAENYYYGSKIAVDLPLAYEWMLRAAEADNAPLLAVIKLGDWASPGPGRPRVGAMPRQRELAEAYYREALRRGDRSLAQKRLAALDAPPEPVAVVPPPRRAEPVEPPPDPALVRLFQGALRAAREIGFQVTSINDSSRRASLQRSHDGHTVRLELEVPRADLLSGNVVVMDDQIRMGFIRLYRDRVRQSLGSVRLDGNVNWQ
jgi:TPR repeat protein